MPNSKSAYSLSNLKEKLDTHIIVVWVDNESGVLARVVGLFSGRGYNIESLAVAQVDEKLNISRITIVTTGTCLLYTSPSPRDRQKSRMPSSA